MITFVTQSGLTLEESIRRIIGQIQHELNHQSGRIIEKQLLETTKNHVQNRYPGSNHYNPNKITPGQSAGNYADINIDIPGITRAYHDINILPKRAQSLTIPIHQSAYGKKTADFNDLFKVKGKNALARVDESGSLVWVFALAKKAFQRQDRTLMPQDETYADNILKALSPEIDQSIYKIINNI